jgi:hypothetical protein
VSEGWWTQLAPVGTSFANGSGVLTGFDRPLALMVIAADRQQARHVFRFIDGLIKALPPLSRMVVVGRTKESITLQEQHLDRGSYGQLQVGAGLHGGRCGL